jgi:hypothetical protein
MTHPKYNAPYRVDEALACSGMTCATCHIHECACPRISMLVYVYTYVYTYMYIYACMYVCMYVYIYIYIYIYIHGLYALTPTIHFQISCTDGLPEDITVLLRGREVLHHHGRSAFPQLIPRVSQLQASLVSHSRLNRIRHTIQAMLMKT